MKIRIKDRRRFNIFLTVAFFILFILSLVFLMSYSRAKRTIYRDTQDWQIDIAPPR